MPSLKLVYFNLRIRGEALRHILEIGKANYEEERIELKDWPVLKEKLTNDGTLPYGTLPLLIDGDKKIVQSCTIGRYLGKKLNLYGKNEDEQLKIDLVMDGVSDARNALLNLGDGNIKEVGSKWLNSFENLKKKNEGKWFVGDNYTIADSFVYVMLEEYNYSDKDCIKNYPNLSKFMDNYVLIPEISSYFKSGKRISTVLF